MKYDVFPSSGDRIWTCDLRVMSPTSFRTAPPRVIKLQEHINHRFPPVVLLYACFFCLSTHFIWIFRFIYIIICFSTIFDRNIRQSYFKLSFPRTKPPSPILSDNLFRNKLLPWDRLFCRIHSGYIPDDWAFPTDPPAFCRLLHRRRSEHTPLCPPGSEKPQWD